MSRSAMVFSLIIVPILLTLLPSTATGQYVFNNSIASCADFDCPSDCRITNRTYVLAGMVPFDTPIGTQNLTWTVGQRYYNPEAYIRDTEKDYYLGTPPDLDLRTVPYNGCAVFFTGTAATFGDYDINLGTCSNVLTGGCTDALQAYARTAVQNLTGNGGEEQLCQRLEAAFAGQPVIPECRVVEGGPEWDGVHVEPITGPNAPQPPSQAENSTSNCHPVIPVSYDLAYVYGFNTTGAVIGSSFSTITRYAIPILTVFTSAGGNNTDTSAILEEPFTSLSCLFAPYLLANAEQTLQSSGAGETRASGFLYGIAMLIAGWLLA